MLLNGSTGHGNESGLVVPSTAAGAIHEPNYTIPQMVFIGTFAAFLSVVTVVGNIMVMISFKIDKQLQTISNYFLFSLAVADFAIGLISMPLFTVSTLLGYWPLGPHICDTWLALDYLASNASVLNLLIISFDRYFSVTRPLTYRVRRTTNKAAIMIGCAWGISLLLWPPWIYSWPYIEGERTVPDDECYIQFIETNHYITFGTAIAAFYVPVTVMCFLYWRIWRTTKKRQKDLPNLQAGKKDSSKRSNSSDEANNTHSTQCPSVVAVNVNVDPNTDGDSNVTGWRGRPRSESSTGAAGADNDSVYLPPGSGGPTRRKATGSGNVGPPTGNYAERVRAWCVAWWHSGREESDTEEDTPSEQNLGYATPVSVETPLQSSVSRCTSLNVIRDPYSQQPPSAINVTPTRLISSTSTAPAGVGSMGARDSRSLPANARLGPRSVSSDSVYTILIRLPAEPPPAGDQQPTIKMIPAVDSSSVRPPQIPSGHLLQPHGGVGGHDDLLPNHIMNRRPSAIPDIRIPLNAKIIPKQLAGKAGAVMGGGPGGRGVMAAQQAQAAKKKKKPQEKKADKKAAKTLSAILLTFIITWTPYNILVLLKPVTANSARIPPQVWDFFYYLCYINSTINPLCYALCNASFRRTYLRILKCKWHNRNRAAMNRGYYN